MLSHFEKTKEEPFMDRKDIFSNVINLEDWKNKEQQKFLENIVSIFEEIIDMNLDAICASLSEVNNTGEFDERLQQLSNYLLGVLMNHPSVTKEMIISAIQSGSIPQFSLLLEEELREKEKIKEILGQLKNS
jgi:ribosome-binding factor A